MQCNCLPFFVDCLHLSRLSSVRAVNCAQTGAFGLKPAINRSNRTAICFGSSPLTSIFRGVATSFSRSQIRSFFKLEKRMTSPFFEKIGAICEKLPCYEEGNQISNVFLCPKNSQVPGKISHTSSDTCRFSRDNSTFSSKNSSFITKNCQIPTKVADCQAKITHIFSKNWQIQSKTELKIAKPGLPDL